jgi:hypothetical protein
MMSQLILVAVLNMADQIVQAKQRLQDTMQVF